MNITFSEFCKQFKVDLPIDLNNEMHRKVLDLYEVSSDNKIETVQTSEFNISFVDPYTGEIVATKKIRHKECYAKPIDQAECLDDIENIFSDNLSYPIRSSMDLSEYLIECHKDASKALLFLCNNVIGSNKSVTTREALGSVVSLKKLSKALRTLEEDGVIYRIQTKLPKKYIVYAISPWLCFRGNKWSEDVTKENWIKRSAQTKANLKL